VGITPAPGLRLRGVPRRRRHFLPEASRARLQAEVKVMFDKVRDMIPTGHIDSDFGKVAALAGVRTFPMLVKRAVQPWYAVAAAVEGRGETGSTESDKE